MNFQADMEISERYIRVCKGNMVKAQQMWQKSLTWRKQNSVATILEEPQPHFHTIKRCYPHFLHGRTRKGELVCYEKPGRFEVKGLIEGNVGPPEMGRHYTFMNELVFTHLLPKDEDQIMTVMDIGEISMSLMNSTVIGYLKATARIMQDHYPERVARICVVNCPFWLPAAWARVSRLMPRTISEKFSFGRSSNAMKVLSKFLEPDQVPSSHGGIGGCLGEAEEEQFVVNFVAKLNGEKSGNLLAGNTEDLFGGSPEENFRRRHQQSSSAPLRDRKMNSASIKLKKSASRELPAEDSARTLEKKKKKKKGLKHKVKKIILRKKKKKNTVAGSEIMTEDDLKGQAEFEQLMGPADGYNMELCIKLEEENKQLEAKQEEIQIAPADGDNMELCIKSEEENKQFKAKQEEIQNGEDLVESIRQGEDARPGSCLFPKVFCEVFCILAPEKIR